MELWDLYTEDRKPTGRTMVRDEEVPVDVFHLAVQVWIKNAEGKYLIAQRAASRTACPLMWECVGGAVIAGETSLEGAIREVKEEVGVDLDPARGRVVFSEICTTVNGKRYNEILDAWLFEYDGELCLENATTDEVAQCGWFSVEEIRELLDSGELVPGRKYFFEKIV